MGTIGVIVGCVAGAGICFVLGRMSKSLRIKTVSSAYKDSGKRSDNQRRYDNVLRLQDELVGIGAIKEKELPDGRIEVSIQVIV